MSYTIRSAASKLGLSEQYIRKQIHLGKIKTTRNKINDSQFRHEISETELARWRERASQRTTRKDGRNKFVIYLTGPEEAELREWLKAKLAQVEPLLDRANKPK